MLKNLMKKRGKTENRKVFGNASTLVPFMPDMVLAGFAPVAKGKPYMSALLGLVDNLNTPDVKFVWTEHEGRIYYIGGKAEDFTLAGSLGCPLASALPGHPAHQGDGAYYFEEAGSFHLVLCKEGRLESYLFEEKSALLQMVETREVPLYSAVDLGGVEAWESDLSITQGKARALIAKVLGVSSLALILALLGFLGSAGAKGYLSPLNAKLQVNIGEQIEKAVNDLNTAKVQPIYVQLDGMQRVFDVVARNKGRVDYFKVEKEQAPIWKIELPVYVPGSAYQHLTPRPIVYEKDGLVIVTNDPKDKGGK